VTGPSPADRRLLADGFARQAACLLTVTLCPMARCACSFVLNGPLTTITIPE
jgi:hypothetical protein